MEIVSQQSVILSVIGWISQGIFPRHVGADGNFMMRKGHIYCEASQGMRMLRQRFLPKESQGRDDNRTPFLSKSVRGAVWTVVRSP